MFAAEIKVNGETKHTGQFSDIHTLKVWAHKQGKEGYDFDYEKGKSTLYTDKERKAVLLISKA